MLKKNIILILVALIVLIICAYLIFFRNKNKSNNNDWLNVFDSSSEEEPVYPFKLGSRGKEVQALQKAINAIYIANDMQSNKPFPLQEDGIYGPLTQAAVIRYLGGTRGNIQGQVSFSEAKKLEKMYEMRNEIKST